MEKNDAIIPLAAFGGTLCDYKKQETTDVNLNSVKRIVDALSNDQIIIYPTTNSGYDEKKINFAQRKHYNPISLYGKTKTKLKIM